MSKFVSGHKSAARSNSPHTVDVWFVGLEWLDAFRRTHVPNIGRFVATLIKISWAFNTTKKQPKKYGLGRINTVSENVQGKS